jgi:heme exporter protein C
MLIYGAYLILGNSIEDKYHRAKILSIYNIFVYPIFIALIIVMPKLIDFSAHPGAGDTEAFTVYDMNNNLRKVFYPAVLGWILMANWIASLYWRYKIILNDKDEKDSYDNHIAA